MRKLSLLLLAAILFLGCQPKGAERYTQDSPEIDTVKKLLANYNSKSYDTSMYADTSKTYYNTKDNPMSAVETIEFHKQSDANYSSRGFVEKDQEYEMVLTDDGNTWVNCWLDWKGTLVANDQEYHIPIHLTYQFIEGKIVREHGHWDPTPIVLAMQEVEKMNNMSADEKAILSAITNITKAWNSNDKEMMASSLTANFTRTENGNTIAENPEEYGGFMDIYHGAFPDFTVKIDKTFISGNKAYMNWTCTGTNTGIFMENQPTNKKIKTQGFSVWAFNKEGKAIQEDAYYDNMVVFNQLGITPQ